MPKARYAEGSAPDIVAARDRCDVEIFAGAVTEEVASAADPFDNQLASEELALLWTLEPDQVRRRWRSLVGRPMPSELGRQLTLRILAYHEQVQRYGDLDRASRRVLADMAPRITRLTVASDVMATADRKGSDAPSLVRTPTLLRAGTVLAREHGGVLHRVLVGADGFSWQGQSYDSLSKVALAITGTRWNGPRFFGLRDGPPRGAKGNGAHADRTSIMVGGGRAGREGQKPRRSVSS